MPQRIDVPGMGVVEFPDSMSDDQISAAIQKNLGGATGGQKEVASHGLAETALDVAKQIPTGVVTGAEAIPSTFPTITSLLGKGVDYLAPGLFTGNQEQNAKMRELAAAQRNGGIAQYLPEAQTPYGKIARSGAEFATGGAGMRGGIRAGIPAGVASEAAGLATEGTAAEPYARLGAALAGGVIGARSADKAAARSLPKEKEVKDFGSQLYRVNEEATAGIPVDKLGVSDFAAEIKRVLNKEGARELNSPKAHELLDSLASKTNDVYDLVKAREVFRKELNAAGESRAANIITTQFDRAIDALSEKGVGVLQAADREWSIGKTLEALNRRFTKVEDQTNSANSGKNLGNKYRQGLTSLKNSGDIRGLKPDELAQIDRVIGGNRTENFLRNYSNRLGGGGGLGQTLLGFGGAGAGYGMGMDPQTSAALGFGLGASGAAARAMANRLTARQANKLREMVAGRSALAAAAPPQFGRGDVGLLGAFASAPAIRGGLLSFLEPAQ